MSHILTAIAAVTPGFDIDTATRAYLDSVQGAARAKSDAYFEGGYWLRLWSTLIAMVSYLIMLRFGWSAKWRDLAERITRRGFLQAMIYTVPFLLIGTLLTAPWDIYAGYVREKQYGLMNQSFGGWLGEQAIMLAVGTLVTAILIGVVFALIRRAPKTWWLWSAGAVTLLMAFFVMVQPVFLAPLLNKYTPMAAGPMRDQILTMAHASHIPADNVYVFDASKQSKRVSANVSGLGPTIRISLNDNLLNRSSPAGVKAVMGHEMGHYVLNHIQWMIVQFGVLLLGVMFGLSWAVPRLLMRYGHKWGVSEPTDLAAAPAYFLVVALMMLLGTPLVNTLIRRHESQADRFGLDAARQPDGFAETAMTLSEYRKLEPTPFEEFVFYDHPSGRTRVRMAMTWKAAHLAELLAGQRGILRPPSASSIPESASVAPAPASSVQR